MDKPFYRGVVGFLSDGEFVLLQKRSRPRWQENKHNGIGGSIEGTEDAVDAMTREWREKTHNVIEGLCRTLGKPIPEWRQFCTMTGTNYELYCFCALCPIQLATISTLCGWNHSQEFTIANWQLGHMLDHKFVHNLCWMIPMAFADGAKPIAKVIAELPPESAEQPVARGIPLRKGNV